MYNKYVDSKKVKQHSKTTKYTIHLGHHPNTRIWMNYHKKLISGKTIGLMRHSKTSYSYNVLPTTRLQRRITTAHLP
jgi:hypothetical protein